MSFIFQKLVINPPTLHNPSDLESILLAHAQRMDNYCAIVDLSPVITAQSRAESNKAASATVWIVAPQWMEIHQHQATGAVQTREFLFKLSPESAGDSDQVFVLKSAEPADILWPVRGDTTKVNNLMMK